MATCPKCGAVVTGKFCGSCGAPQDTVAAAAMPQPPQVPGGSVPTPPPFPGQTPPPFPGQMPSPYPGQPGFGPAPQPPKKSRVGLVLGIIGGVLALLVVGVVLIVMLAPTPEPEPAPVAQKNTPSTPAPNPTSAPNPTPAQPDNKTPQYQVKTLAQGKLDFQFQSYDGFAGNQLAVGRSTNGKVELMVYEFSGKSFDPAVEAMQESWGKLNDVNHGKIFNDGKDYAIAVADQGLIVVPEDDDAQFFDGKGLLHAFVGDYDADGKYETLTVGQDSGGFYSLNVWRYKPDGSGDKLKSFGAQAILDGTQVVTIDKQSYLLGIEPAKPAGQLPLALYSVSVDKGLQSYLSIPIHQANGETVTGYAMGTVVGKLSLVVAYQPASGNSYVELFDISAASKTPQQPPSRGKVTMPDNQAYQVVLGTYTQKQNLEILLMTGGGDWFVAGF